MNQSNNEPKKELTLEFHKPTSGFVRISDDKNNIVMDMRDYDLLDSDPYKRHIQLEELLKTNS